MPALLWGLGRIGKALAREGKNHRYAYNLGLALMRLGRPAEARPFFEKALALRPGLTPARERLVEIAGKKKPRQG